jgi:hypothetical protein
LSFTQSAFAQFFYSKTEAFELACGKATIENLPLFPDNAESAKIGQLAKTKRSAEFERRRFASVL